MDFRSLLMVAGEVSGDMHAARLLSEIRKLQPGIHAFGMGGAELREAGMEVLADSGEISVVGISEAL
ncbi:MAG: lipid-A-disaccharide synthase, partial [Thermoanaerobaculia bacterium]